MVQKNEKKKHDDNSSKDEFEKLEHVDHAEDTETEKHDS